MGLLVSKIFLWLCLPNSTVYSSDVLFIRLSFLFTRMAIIVICDGICCVVSLNMVDT